MIKKSVFLILLLLLGWQPTPAYSKTDPSKGFIKLFRVLEGSGSIQSVINRKKWPKNDKLASYLELELFFHPRYKSTVKRAKSFLKRWPNHVQAGRIRAFLERRLTKQGSNSSALQWYDTNPPKYGSAKLRYLALMLEKKRTKQAWPLWLKLYRQGARFSETIEKRSRSFYKRITLKDQETRMRALLHRGASYKKLLAQLPAKRRPFFETLNAAIKTQKKFNRLIKKLSSKGQRNSELWGARLGGLYTHKKNALVKKMLLGKQGSYLTVKDRQRLRYKLGRKLLFHYRDSEGALDVLRGNVAEAGAKLSDSLWFAAWSAYQTGDYSQAKKWFILLAKESVSSKRRAQGAYWAVRLSSSEKERRKWLAYASRYPETFYGLLAKEQSSGGLKPLEEVELRCPSAWGGGVNREIKDLKLLKGIGRGYYNGPEIRRLAKNYKLSLEDQLCLSQLLDGSNHAIWVANKLKKLGTLYWSGLYPIPDLTPLRGWGLDPAVVWAVIRQESLFSHRARSSAKAMGMMQLIAPTARQEAKLIGLPSSNRYRLNIPTYNLALGQSYLIRMLQRFDNDLILATAAYNAGPTRVNKWKTRRKHEDPLTFIEMIPLTETRNYVKRVLHGLAIYRLRLYGKASIAEMLDPEKSGLTASSTIK